MQCRDRLSTDLSENALMMAEPNSMPKKAREQLVELIFEKYKPPALFLAKNAVGGSGHLEFVRLRLGCLSTVLLHSLVTAWPWNWCD